MYDPVGLYRKPSGALAAYPMREMGEIDYHRLSGFEMVLSDNVRDDEWRIIDGKLLCGATAMRTLSLKFQTLGMK